MLKDLLQNKITSSDRHKFRISQFHPYRGYISQPVRTCQNVCQFHTHHLPLAVRIDSFKLRYRSGAKKGKNTRRQVVISALFPPIPREINVPVVGGKIQKLKYQPTFRMDERSHLFYVNSCQNFYVTCQRDLRLLY